MGKKDLEQDNADMFCGPSPKWVTVVRDLFCSLNQEEREALMRCLDHQDPSESGSE